MMAIEAIQNKYGKEIALLVLCCRIYFDTESRTALQQFIDTNTINWDHFKLLADYHRIEPIAFKTLGDVNNIPTDIATSIKQKQFFLIHQSFQRAIETERIICLLNNNHIRCIPYKGVVFSKQFYGDLTSRESSDIDLIISPDDFGKALQLMLQEGYSFEQEYEYAYFGKAIFSRQKEMNFNKYKENKREFHVEFHWRISDNVVQLKQEANALLYESTYKEKLVKEEIDVLNKSAHYLAVFIHHSNNDAFSVLRNLIDLCLIKNTTDNRVEIQQVNDAISRFRLTNAAAVCCRLSNDLLGVSLPIVTPSGISISSSTINHFVDHLLKQELLGKHQKAKLYNNSIFLLKDTIRQKTAYLTACLSMRFKPSAKDLRTFKIPKSLYFLYYVLKPFRSMFSRVDHEEEKKVAMQHSEQNK